MSISKHSKPINQGVSGYVNAWLQSWGFLANPFENWDADREYLPLLSRYYIKPPFYDQLLTEHRSALIYARRGGGKSAARIMVESECGPISASSPVLSISFTDFSYFVDDFTNIQNLALKDYVELLIPAILTQLLVAINAMTSDAIALDKQQIHELRFWLDQFVPYWMTPKYKEDIQKSLSSVIYLKSTLSSHSRHSELARLIQESQQHLTHHDHSNHDTQLTSLFDKLYKQSNRAGSRKRNSSSQSMVELIEFCRATLSSKNSTCQGLFLLIDGVDEYKLTQKDPQAAAKLLDPLLGNIKFLEKPGLAVKFFLPLEFRPAFEEATRADRLPNYTLSWLDETHGKESLGRMRELLQTRLIRYSNGEIRSLSEMCTPELRNTIEEILIQESKATPRHILQLGNQIFVEHCREVSEPESEISTKDLNRALDWYRGSITSSASASISMYQSKQDETTVDKSARQLRIDLEAGRVYIGDVQLRPLPDLQYRLLVYLYRRKGHICSRDEITQAVYQNDAGITDQTLGSLIYRLKNALHKVSPEFSREHYIKTEEGRGYSLQNSENWKSP